MRPIADADHLRVLAAAPNQDRIPPCLFDRFAGIRKCGVGIGGLNGRLKVRKRREGLLCLDPAGA
jgi:hypothetical protein